MANRPAAHAGAAANDTGSPQPMGPSAFQRELDRARRHLARLEAEDQLRRQLPAMPDQPVHFDESPALVRVCNVLLWAIVLLPFALGLAVLVRRFVG